MSNNAIGDGQGQGGPPQGDGGRSECKCTKCGHVQKHERGTPCVEQKCSECGAAMAPIAENADFAKLVEIKGMAFFKVGTHNGLKFSEKDLDEIVEHFKALKGQIRPKLKITHGENQKKIAGLASYGDITRVFAKTVTDIIDGVKKKVKVLFVDLANVPEQVKDWIDERRFPERSAEIWTKLMVGGKTFKNVLRNVSLLGHEPPAVPGLAVVKTADDDGEFMCVTVSFNGDEEFVRVTEETDPEGGENEMDKEMVEKLQAQIDGLKSELEAATVELAKKDEAGEKARMQEQMTKLEEKLADAVTQKAEFEKLQKAAEANDGAAKKLEKLEAQNRADAIEASVKTLKEDKHIFPKEESAVRALMESFNEDVIKLSVPDGDDSTKDIESTQAVLLKSILMSRKHNSFEEITPKDGDEENENVNSGSKQNMADGLKYVVKQGTTIPVGEGDGSDVELEKKIAKYMADNDGVNYRDAMLAVADAYKEGLD